MKNKVGIIILIVLLTIITVSLIFFLVLCLTGRFTFVKFNGFGGRSQNIIYDETYTMGNIKNIEILSEASDVTFKESENQDIRVVAYGKYNEDINVTNKEGELTINYKMKKRIIFGFNMQNTDIIVYIPKEYTNEININNDYGNCKITDLEKATLNIKADCGDIKIGKVKNIIAKANYGNINIEAILNKCNLELDCGNVKIDKLEIKENSFIYSNYGNIKIKEKNDIYVDAEVDLGNKNIESNNRHAETILKLKADCGNIKVGE